MKTVLKSSYLIVILLVLHVVGTAGFALYPAFFLKLVPFHLFTIALLLYLGVFNNFKSLLVIFLVSFLGWVVEVVGVKTGLVFGDYSYGETLGYKVLAVPLSIGLNWGALLYATYVLLADLKLNFWVKIFTGALIVVFLDYFIEPVAIQLDFWTWNDIDIPVQNYVAWFVLSSLLLIVLFKSKIKKVPKSLAFSFLIIQLLFFVAMKFIL